MKPVLVLAPYQLAQQHIGTELALLQGIYVFLIQFYTELSFLKRYSVFFIQNGFYIKNVLAWA